MLLILFIPQRHQLRVFDGWFFMIIKLKKKKEKKTQQQTITKGKEQKKHNK